MSSIIEGYNYDIFISYRQKDNRGEHWVSEFVESLKTELESTFKEEVSVYFDINPHDGLLETHDVDASLKEKLKCLIFIPIISRTYCDPKSFAWEHEFKAFVEQASKDQFGLKVKLPNGNVASRVLPVRIHDLDKEDNKLCETATGGFLRGVEFIYKEPGVNRPLRANEENPHENLNHTLYRNQINKVANSIKDVILGLVTYPSTTADEKIKIGVPEERAITIKKKSYHTKSYKNVISRFRKMGTWSLAGLLTISILSILLYLRTISQISQPVIRFNHQLPQNENIGGEIRGSAVAFSPDGTILAFVSSKNETTSLYLRRIDEFETRLVQGSEGAEAPFFSPDNKWIAFFADGNLKKVSIVGGAPQIICEARSGLEGSWGEDNTIIFADNYKACLIRVPSAGGKPEQLTNALKFTIGEGEHSHYWPQILPEGKVILFTIWHNSEDMRIVAYHLESGERFNIIGPGSHARYIKSGHLIYAWKGDILAVPFNPVKLKVEGPPVLLIKGVMMNHIGLAHFSISANGSLVYIPGDINKSENMLVLVDHEGNAESLNVQASQSPRFSPDGKYILFEHNQGLANAWIYGLERGILRRFTEKEYETFWAIWTPDGERIVFNSNMHGGNAVNLFWKKSDGTGSAEQLTKSNYHQQPKCFSNDGKLLIYTEGINPMTGMDILMIQIIGDTIPIPLLNTRYNETHPLLSPDGKWLAYVSDESGREEVFVCSFPDLGNKTQISTNGGMEPLWAPNGKEVYYRDVTGNKIMVVTFIPEPNLRVEKPRLLFEGKFRGSSGPWGSNYDITPDGERFLLIEEGKVTTGTKQFNLILNWAEDLKSLVRKGKEKQRQSE